MTRIAHRRRRPHTCIGLFCPTSMGGGLNTMTNATKRVTDRNPEYDPADIRGAASSDPETRGNGRERVLESTKYPDRTEDDARTCSTCGQDIPRMNASVRSALKPASQRFLPTIRIAAHLGSGRSGGLFWHSSKRTLTSMHEPSALRPSPCLIASRAARVSPMEP